MEAGRDEASAAISNALAQRGLAAPASILLDAHRPFLPILRLAGIFLSPLASPLLGRWRLDRLLATAADPTAYDRLSERLRTRDVSPPTSEQEA